MNSGTPLLFVSPVCALKKKSDSAAVCSVRRSEWLGLSSLKPSIHSENLSRSRGTYRVLPSANMARPPRTQSGWSRSLQTVPASLILKLVRPQIGLALAVSSAVVACQLGWENVFGYAFPTLPTVPHSVLATSVSLILVFRTNAAYDRFWEGRKLWGSIVNTSRNMCRLAVNTMEPAAARTAGLLIVSYVYSLAQRLEQTGNEEPCATLLGADPALATRINSATHKPLECLVTLGELIRDPASYKEGFKKWNSESDNPRLTERLNMEECIRELSNFMGGCERIVACPVPLSYSRHCSRLISMFVLTLPFVLVGYPGGNIASVPACTLLTWALCGIDEVAHLIEDPFLGETYSLPLTSICNVIERDLLEQLTSPLSLSPAGKVN